jgi:hypothetical protein
MSMDAKSRLILALLMSSVMVCMVTLLVTFLDLGLRPDFLIQWAKAYFIAWPVAAATAFFIMPSARHHAVGASPHGSDRRFDRWSALIVACACPCPQDSGRVFGSCAFRTCVQRGGARGIQCRTIAMAGT